MPTLIRIPISHLKPKMTSGAEHKGQQDEGEKSSKGP